MPVSAVCLAPESAAPPSIVAPDTGPAGPVVVVEREVSSMADLEALSAGPPFPAADAWRTAASEGVVRFESEAIRQVIRNHTDEAGVTQLTAKLVMLCRQAMQRRPRGDAGPEVITPDVVRDVLGEGTIDALPAAVCAAIARERQRVADKSDGDAKPTNNWTTWLEQSAMDSAQHGADRPGARARGARCRARRPRARQGAHPRVPGRAATEPARHGRGDLPLGPAESGFIMHTSLFH